MSLREVFNYVNNQVKSNPRKCDLCGTVETIDNLMLIYKGGVTLCDDCLLIYDFSEVD